MEKESQIIAPFQPAILTSEKELPLNSMVGKQQPAPSIFALAPIGQYGVKAAKRRYYHPLLTSIKNDHR